MLEQCREALGQSWAAPGQQPPWSAHKVRLYGIVRALSRNGKAVSTVLPDAAAWH